MNNYEIIGLPNNSTIENVKKRYYQLAKEYHPDKTKNDPIKAEKFLTIKNAYEQLLKGVENSNSNSNSKYNTNSSSSSSSSSKQNTNKQQYYNDLYNEYNVRGTYRLNSIKNIKDDYYFNISITNIKYIEVIDKYHDSLGRYTFDTNFNGNLVVSEKLFNKNEISLKIVDYGYNVLYKQYKIKPRTLYGKIKELFYLFYDLIMI